MVKDLRGRAEKRRVRTVARHSNDVALVAVALLISVYIALSATSLGDYPADGGPALATLLQGNLHAFALARPLMGALSLLVRAPFAEIAYIGHATELSVYRWGVLPCVTSVAVLSLWLVRLARSRGTGPAGQWAIVLVSLVNPLSASAIALGHPEELLTASLCTGALVAALERRGPLSALLLGLALACKQWSLVTILPVLLALDRGRLRALLGALAVAAIVSVPEMVGAPVTYLQNQLSLARHQGRAPSSWSWWWLLGRNTTLHLVVAGAKTSIVERRLPSALAHWLRSLVILVDLLVAAIVARVRRLPLRSDDAFALMAVVLLLRCTLDSESTVYYHVPLLLDLLAWDAIRGERVPIRALAATAVAYLLFDRLPASFAGAPASLLYDGCTAVCLILLLRTLSRRPARSSQPIGPPLAATA